MMKFFKSVFLYFSSSDCYNKAIFGNYTYLGKQSFSNNDSVYYLGARRVTVCHESSFMHQLLMHENVLCYRKDEDWPLEIIVQEMVSNHP